MAPPKLTDYQGINALVAGANQASHIGYAG